MSGRVSWLSWDRECDFDVLALLQEKIHEDNRAAGWYHDPATGDEIERNPAEMLCLIHSEISEALEGVRKGEKDKHLPHRPAEEVELADAMIRMLDYAGYRGLDLAGAMQEKLHYNQQREDHRPESRAAAGGKRF